LLSNVLKLALRVGKTRKEEEPVILVRHKYLTKDIPVSLVMTALGAGSDIDIVRLVCGFDEE
jgi:hypothetical protein